MSRGSAQYCLQRGEVMLASDFLRIDKMWGVVCHGSDQRCGGVIVNSVVCLSMCRSIYRRP